MNTYEKTYNLFARFKEKPFIGKYNEGEYFTHVFPKVAQDAWVYTEKIDGMNMRVIIDDAGAVSIRGRSNKAQIPGDLQENIEAMVVNRSGKLIALAQNRGVVTLYGEGYGPGIQKGQGYRDTKGFVLFDIALSGPEGEGGYFMAPHDMLAFAESANLNMAPRLWPSQPLNDVVRYVREGFRSPLAWDNTREILQSEGIIAHAPGLFYHYDNSMRRMKFKLKTKDFPVFGGENE